MDPIVWLLGALAALASFTGWLVRWALTHLENDLAYSRRVAARGTDVAEKGADLLEKKISGG